MAIQHPQMFNVCGRSWSYISKDCVYVGVYWVSVGCMIMRSNPIAPVEMRHTLMFLIDFGFWSSRIGVLFVTL